MRDTLVASCLPMVPTPADTSAILLRSQFRSRSLSAVEVAVVVVTGIHQVGELRPAIHRAAALRAEVQ